MLRDITSAKGKPHKLDMTPAQIATKMGPATFVKLCGIVENNYHQKFGIIDIKVVDGTITVEVELADETRHIVTL
jgi:hypothetical protein